MCRVHGIQYKLVVDCKSQLSEGAIVAHPLLYYTILYYTYVLYSQYSYSTVTVQFSHNSATFTLLYCSWSAKGKGIDRTGLNRNGGARKERRLWKYGSRFNAVTGSILHYSVPYSYIT